jgi:hypothetical protein
MVPILLLEKMESKLFFIPAPRSVLEEMKSEHISGLPPPPPASFTKADKVSHLGILRDPQASIFADFLFCRDIFRHWKKHSTWTI